MEQRYVVKTETGEEKPFSFMLEALAFVFDHRLTGVIEDRHKIRSWRFVDGRAGTVISIEPVIVSL